MRISPKLVLMSTIADEVSGAVVLFDSISDVGLLLAAESVLAPALHDANEINNVVSDSKILCMMKKGC